MATAAPEKKGYKGIGMEGMIARWYARNTGRNIEDFRKAAKDVARRLPAGSDVLEVAPGPGFLAIELARLGPYRIVGLDISTSFVRIAQDNAARAGVAVTFREGNASSMPFEANSFDFIYCRAAFKNFSEPAQAIHDMYRVLKPGGEAVIVDLRRDASDEAIKAAVSEMGLNRFNAALTRWTLRWLRKRAHSEDDFRRMAAATPFGTCEIKSEPIALEVSFRK